MGNEKQNAILQEHPRSGEQILWHGWAEPGAFLEGTDKKRSVQNWVIECVVVGVFLAFYLSVAEVLNATFLIGLLLIAALVACAPYVEWRKLKHQQY